MSIVSWDKDAGNNERRTEFSLSVYTWWPKLFATVFEKQMSYRISWANYNKHFYFQMYGQK